MEKDDLLPMDTTEMPNAKRQEGLLTEDEYQRLLYTWNATTQDYPSELCLHELITQQAEKTPDAIAAVFEHEQLTYQELNRRANLLARRLQAEGVGPEVLVGICMERSLELLIGLIGILKSGGAYVPLDPTYPKERLAFMLSDAQVTVIVTQQKWLAIVETGEHPVLCLDGQWYRELPENDISPESSASVNNLIYVIYTSGSTGRPKGAMNTQRGLCNRLDWMQKAYTLNGIDRILQKTPYSFDVSVWEFYWPLLNGACMVLARPEGHKDNTYLVNLIAEQSITVLHFVPSMLLLFLEEPYLERCNSLKHVICSGEALPFSLQERFFEHLNASLHNLYGPTEASIDVTFWNCQPSISLRTVPIGHPIANTQIYLLDVLLQPVPIGVPAELYIGGDGLARGYFGKPELTAERFIPNPFSAQLGARLYRTGDLARYRPDGALEYLGRLDQQVKIRGFRIELAEIEMALAEHPAVRDVVVMVREDQPANKQLVAYLIAQPSHSHPSVPELRARLRTTLPEYMLPAAFLWLTAFPLSPNGKLDRQALPAPSEWEEESDDLQGPQTPTEEMLVHIWMEVLGRRQIGRQTHFFESGGHSLLVTQMLARLRRKVQVEIPMALVFEHPHLSELAEQLDQLQKRSTEAPLLPAIVHQESRTEHPLSFAQQGLWFLSQLEPDNPFYNIARAYSIHGHVRISALEASLQILVQRHESLRSIVSVTDGVPQLHVHPKAPTTLSVIDLREVPASSRREAASKFLHQEAAIPFDLNEGPLFRFHLLWVQEDEYILIVTLHHLIADGWSLEVFQRELVTLYSAQDSSRASILPPLPIQYQDYVRWQQGWLQGEMLEQQKRYWQEQLQGSTGLLTLPTDHPRPPIQSFHGAEVHWSISSSLRERLKEVSQQQGVTFYMLLLAAFAALLMRYSGQEDLVIGTAVANRNEPELEDLIGFFVNTLAIRLYPRADESFQDFLVQVRQSMLQAQDHHDLPFEKLVEGMQIERLPNGNPLFQVMFVLQNHRQLGLTTGDAEIEIEDIASGTAKFDLVLELIEVKSGVEAKFEYNTDLFDAVTIERMARAFQTLLDNIVTQPNEKLALLSLQSKKDLQQLLVQWNPGVPDGFQPLCIHTIFEERAERNPDAVVLQYEHHSLTYGELDRRANQLAHYLQRHGVEPDVCVGLCVQRSLEMVIGIVGILKAGGAYVPIDSGYPAERLDFLFSDLHLSLLLTDASLQENLDFRGTKILLDSAWPIIANEPEMAPQNDVTPEHLAYVIYTSGTTGLPKGSMIPHRSIPGFMVGNQVMHLSSPLIHLQHSSRSWDALTLELWPALLYGGCCVLYPGDHPTLDQLAEIIHEHNVQTVWITASLFNTIINTQPEVLLGVEQVLCGGEALSLKHIQRALECLPGTHIVNGYGPSECTVFATGYSLESLHDTNWTSVPIGYALGDRQVYLVDTLTQLVPIGVPGELVIGGPSVPRGYLGRATLTAEKFIPDPFSAQLGARLYRTGDLARYRPDGALEYLGRLDQQVKIRGFRIELAEIEMALAEHPAVRDVVVMVREDQPADKQLVAYLIAQPSHSHPSVPELRARLRTTLPEYMLPAAFLWLTAFPLSPNGKLDRQALPAPSEWEEESDDLQGPQTPTEEMLVHIWMEVLGRRQIGRQTHFFESGGHSLLVTQMLARLRRKVQIEIPVQLVFNHPRLAELAAQLDQLRQGNDTIHMLPAIVHQESRTEHPLSFAQQRLWFLSQLEPDNPFYNIARAYSIHGHVRISALEASLQILVQRHESLRSIVSVTDGVPQLHVHPKAPTTLSVIDLREVPASSRREAASKFLHQEAAIPFDLNEGPLFRFHLLWVQEDEYILIVTLHHLIADGWSLEVFQRELVTLYSAQDSSRASILPPLPIQYQDYVRWQQGWLQGEMLEQQKRYWQEQLQGSTGLLTLPTDHPRPPIQSFHGAEVHWSISSSLRERLKEVSQQQGVTFYMLLLAAFAALLMRYSGQEDLVIGTAVANRNEPELEDLIGFFVNTLAIRLYPRADESFQDFLVQVRQSMLQAQDHHDLPFEKLVEVLKPERSLSHNPLFQVAFALWSSSDLPMMLDDAMLTVHEINNGTTKQDLMLNILDTADELLARWEYNTDIFERDTILRIARNFQMLLEGLVAHTEQVLAMLPLIDIEDQQRILHLWNDTHCQYSEQLCFHQLFEQQVAAVPDAIAVAYEGSFLTYQQLDWRANQLAHRLRAMDVGPETFVGISVERSIEMIIGLLAVFKAGGAYVPLDPSYPPERLRFMLTEAQVTVLLTQRHLGTNFDTRNVPIVYLDEPWYSEETKEYCQVPESDVTPDNLAYLIYTSGSTGQPKGVMVPHRGLCSLAQAQAQAFGAHAQDRVLQFASLSFDASIWEILMAFTARATLQLAPVASLLPGSPLLELLEKEAITIATLSPSVLALLPAKPLPALQTLITAGEACTPDLIARWSPGRTFYNAYGPTETTVCASIAACLPGTPPLIGTAIANMQLYILDAYYQLVPPGVAGELYLGGVGLARGYLQKASLTATRFVPDPFSRELGARLYRTGDSARYDPDGSIQFIGRMDRQVKVRGFRIELGEIEAVLNEHTQVRESIIVVREAGLGDRRLAAYLVPESNNVLDIEEVHTYLRARLPTYMVPAALVILESLPLTTNGKVDYRSLPAPEIHHLRKQTDYIAPANQREQAVSKIWCELLNVQAISVHDNFFDLGGHSLLLTRLQDRLQKDLGGTISMLELFQHTTIRALATYMDQEHEAHTQHIETSLQAKHEQATQRREAASQQRERRQNRPSNDGRRGGNQG